MTRKKEVQNILIVSLNDNFSKKVSYFLSEKLDMLTLDCNEMIVYELVNPKEIFEKCGLEYLKKRERGVVKNCATFLNTCITIDYDLIFQYSELFDKSLIFFLKLPFNRITKVPNLIDFENRNKTLEKLADQVIYLDKKSVGTAVNNIIEKIGEMYENC